MFAPGLSERCRHLARRLRARCTTSFDEDAEHVQRYAAWAMGHHSAAEGVRTAACTLKEAAKALEAIEAELADLTSSVKGVQQQTVKLESLFGRGPEQDLKPACLATLAERLATAAHASLEMTSCLPGSTVWVKLPDPSTCANTLEATAQALEEGHQMLEELRARLLAAERRMWAAEEVEPGPSGKGHSECHKSQSPPTDWKRARECLKCLRRGSRPTPVAAAMVVDALNQSFHVFDDLTAQLARLFEEMVCLDTDVSSLYPSLLAAAEVQSELLGWKLQWQTVLSNAPQAASLPPGFEEFLQTVLAVGDVLANSAESLEQRRKVMVEELKTSIEIQAARNCCREGEASLAVRVN